MTGPARITFDLDGWAVWDGASVASEARVRKVAGEQFLKRARDAVIVQGAGGRVERMEPGWAVYRATGAQQATVCSPEAWAAMGGPQAAA